MCLLFCQMQADAMPAVQLTLISAAAVAAVSFAAGMVVMWLVAAGRTRAAERENALLRQQVALATELDKRREEQQSSLADQFRLMSSQALAQNSKELKDNNREAMAAIVDPVKQLLEQLKSVVSQASILNTENTASLKGQIEELMKQTMRIGNDAVELARALKSDAKRRGNWGELVLASILESSGLREGEQYVLQPYYKTEDGGYYPDAVILLPDKRSLVVDSKVSLVAYERYVNAPDEQSRREALKSHKESMRRHMKSLADKAYSRLPEGETLDYVIMFVPIEAAYIAAFHDDDKDVLLEGCKSRVLIVSPTNLIMALKLALHLWRKNRQLDGVRDVVRIATALYDKCVAFNKHFSNAEQSMRNACDAFAKMKQSYSAGRGSLLGKVIELHEKGGLESTKTALELPEVDYADSLFPPPASPADDQL